MIIKDMWETHETLEIGFKRSELQSISPLVKVLLQRELHGACDACAADYATSHMLAGIIQIHYSVRGVRLTNDMAVRRAEKKLSELINDNKDGSLELDAPMMGKQWEYEVEIPEPDDLLWLLALAEHCGQLPAIIATLAAV